MAALPSTEFRGGPNRIRTYRVVPSVLHGKEVMQQGGHAKRWGEHRLKQHPVHALASLWEDGARFSRAWEGYNQAASRELVGKQAVVLGVPACQSYHSTMTMGCKSYNAASRLPCWLAAAQRQHRNHDDMQPSQQQWCVSRDCRQLRRST